MNLTIYTGGKEAALNIQYSSRKLEKQCSNLEIAKRVFGQIVGEKLIMAVRFLESAENLKDVQMMPTYHLHVLKGNRKKQYSMYLGKNLGFRIVLIPLDKNWVQIKEPNEISLMNECVNVKIEEVSNHYE